MRVLSTMLAVAALTGLPLACQGPTPADPLIICHNSNCVEPPEPTQDDTLDALRRSLSLRDDAGAPLLDGVEVDLFWYGAEDRCIFAHDLSGEVSVDALDVVAPILGHLRGLRHDTGSLTRSGEPFVLFVELKGHVGESKSDKHSPEQRARHAACGLDLLEALMVPALAEDLPLKVRFTSFDPLLLGDMAAALQRGRWLDSDSVDVGCGVIQGLPSPLDSQTAGLDQFDATQGIDLATVHPHWMRDADLQAFDSRGWDLGFWMFSAVPETYAAIRRYHPRYLTTNEAATLDRWLRH